MKIARTFLRVVTLANIVVILASVICGYSDRIDPRAHGVMANFGLGFPVFLVLNMALLAFWLLFHRRKVWLPVVGILLCWSPIRLYFPINIPETPPQGAIKVLSFNVWMFNTSDLPAGEVNPIADYIANSGADIVCLQESSCDQAHRQGIDSLLASVYQYRDTVQKEGIGGDVLSLYTRFPILRRERIRYESNTNLSEAYILDVNGSRVLLVNNHFETSGLSPDDKANFREFVHGGMPADSTRKESATIFDKLAVAAAKRAPQADSVHEYIERCRRRKMSVIVCGDFNDSPISYTRRRVASGLTDCYVASGMGAGWSYHHDGIRVRIDNIFCSNEWLPYGAFVDKSIGWSDHYPIVCWLKRQR